MGTVSNLSFQHANADDDLFVTMFSNDVDSKRLDQGESIRVFWETKLPMRLDFSEEEWEVALTEFSCRNREQLDVEVLARRSDDNDYLEVFSLPKGIYDSKLELVSEAYDILNSKTVVADKPTIDFVYEEFHFLRHVYGAGGFRVSHYIVQNENLAKFSDSDASV